MPAILQVGRRNYNYASEFFGFRRIERQHQQTPLSWREEFFVLEDLYNKGLLSARRDEALDAVNRFGRNPDEFGCVVVVSGRDGARLRRWMATIESSADASTKG